MYTSTASLSLFVGLIGIRVAANPIVGSMLPCQGDWDYRYDIHETLTNQPGKAVTAARSCVGSGGKFPFPAFFFRLLTSAIIDCTLGDGISFARAVSVTVGAELGLDIAKIAGSAGISASVTTSEENGQTSSVEKHCPEGPWYCSLAITPAVTVVKGTRYRVTAACKKNPTTEENYEISYPEIKDNLAGASVDLCTCKNAKHWADDGHYATLCPQDCPGIPFSRKV